MGKKKKSRYHRRKKSQRVTWPSSPPPCLLSPPLSPPILVDFATSPIDQDNLKTITDNLGQQVLGRQVCREARTLTHTHTLPFSLSSPRTHQTRLKLKETAMLPPDSSLALRSLGNTRFSSTIVGGGTEHFVGSLHVSAKQICERVCVCVCGSEGKF